MAAQGDEAKCSPESLICPLCLDVFEDATLLVCGHTFCRKCLKRYDASHQDKNHIVCPLCRVVTKFDYGRVDKLPANITVNGLIDDFKNSKGGRNSIPELRVVKCITCASSNDAVSFCSTCNNYMCEQCLGSHKQLTAFFKDHQIVSMQEIESGTARVNRELSKCSEHRLENKDMFCEDCRIYICFKCVIVGHRDHKITNQIDFTKGLTEKVDHLVELSATKKKNLEKNIKKSEALRQEVLETMKKLETEVKDTYKKKAAQLQENEQALLKDLKELALEFDDNLEILKLKDSQRIKCIDSSTSLIAHDRLGSLESDNLSAHSMICDELKEMLHDVIDETSAEVVLVRAKNQRFRPADKNVLDLDKIQERELDILKEVQLKGAMNGITSMPGCKVAISYSGCFDADVVDAYGNCKMILTSRKQGHSCKDVSNKDGLALVVTLNESKYALYSQDRHYILTTRNFPYPGIQGHYPCISSTPKNLVIANKGNNICVIDAFTEEVKYSITTQDKPMQAFQVNAGLIISSTGNAVLPGKLTAYDKQGRKIHTLTADKDCYLYATADSEGTIYVASVCVPSQKVVITQYEKGVRYFKKVFQYKAVQLTVGDSWCYFASLSPNMLAFASFSRLYFIKIQS